MPGMICGSRQLFDAAYQMVANGNGVTGIYFGCSPKGPIGSRCGRGIGPSNHNTIVASVAQGNKGAGIAIDFSDSRTLVTGSVSAQNGTKDAVNENAKCDNNSWDGRSVGHNFAELRSLVRAARPPCYSASLFRLTRKTPEG